MQYLMNNLASRDLKCKATFSMIIVLGCLVINYTVAFFEDHLSVLRSVLIGRSLASISDLIAAFMLFQYNSSVMVPSLILQ